MAAVAGRPVAVDGRPVAGRPEPSAFVAFLERGKRKGFGNFLVEARVDEWCYSPLQNGSEMKYIWRERKWIGRWRWIGKDLMANN